MANKFLKALAFTGAAIFSMAQQTHAQNEVTESQMRVDCNDGKPKTIVVNTYPTTLVGNSAAGEKDQEVWTSFICNLQDATIQEHALNFVDPKGRLGEKYNGQRVPASIASEVGNKIEVSNLSTSGLNAFKVFSTQADKTCNTAGKENSYNTIKLDGTQQRLATTIQNQL